MRAVFESKQFKKDMKNLINYSIGFLDGMQAGKQKFLVNLGMDTSEMASQFIDANARVSPQTLHHVYEWYQVGSPNARLFDIDYTVNRNGVSFISSFTQSATIQHGSNAPFREKASIMENGISVTIKPKNSDVLRFEDNGDIIYTKKQVVVNNPGGITRGQFQQTFELFFGNYFTQAFLKNSGLQDYFARPKSYKKNLAAGVKGGKTVGYQTGYRWVANAGAMIR